MLKPLLIILFLVTLLAIGLNIDFSDSEPQPTPTASPTVEVKEETPQESVVAQPIQTSIDENKTNDNNDTLLAKEIDALFKKGTKYFQNNEDDEAQKIYNLILKKIGKRDSYKFIKYFTTAYFQKAFIYNIYPNNEKDLAFDAYEMIIKRFEKSNDPKLLLFYIDAKIEQSYLVSSDEIIEIYDQLIKKFQTSTDPMIQKKIEDILLQKSFALMGKNDEEAMEILDQIIENHQKMGAKSLPENIQNSIFNNIELAIITNNDDDKYRELAEKYMPNSPDREPLLDMLSIIKNSPDMNQDEELDEWYKKHGDYRFPNWSFDELRRWAYRMEDDERKKQVIKYLDSFENYKYNVYDKGQDSNKVEVQVEVHPKSNNSVNYQNPYENDEESY